MVIYIYSQKTKDHRPKEYVLILESYHFWMIEREILFRVFERSQ